uniref:Uncharacterized protein n=1 Tax=Ceratitis capitata TaxID=7213 RepID=W8BYG6_CERCA
MSGLGSPNLKIFLLGVAYIPTFISKISQPLHINILTLKKNLPRQKYMQTTKIWQHPCFHVTTNRKTVSPHLRRYFVACRRSPSCHCKIDFLQSSEYKAKVKHSSQETTSTATNGDNLLNVVPH